MSEEDDVDLVSLDSLPARYARVVRETFDAQAADREESESGSGPRKETPKKVRRTMWLW
jgi:hypothetical protein